jgi:hypothetical protein
MLRFLPMQLRMSAAGQAAEQQQQVNTEDEQAQEANRQQATAAAAAAEDVFVEQVSPFRPAMHGKLIRRIHKRHAQHWLRAVRQQLRRLLPSQAEFDRVRAGGHTDNRLLQLLSRANFARLSPGVVSLSEVAKVSGAAAVVGSSTGVWMWHLHGKQAACCQRVHLVGKQHSAGASVMPDLGCVHANNSLTCRYCQE